MLILSLVAAPSSSFLTYRIFSDPCLVIIFSICTESRNVIGTPIHCTYGTSSAWQKIARTKLWTLQEPRTPFKIKIGGTNMSELYTLLKKTINFWKFIPLHSGIEIMTYLESHAIWRAYLYSSFSFPVSSSRLPISSFSLYPVFE